MQTDLRKITVRLPSQAAEQLRAAAFAARMQPAALARRLIVMSLAAGEHVPPPAPPAAADLQTAARDLLTTLAASSANFSQLKTHAREIGGRLAAIAAEGEILDQLMNEARALGLHIKLGRPCPPDSLTGPVHVAADTLNQLAKRLNTERESVPDQEWARAVIGFKSPIRATNSWVEREGWR